MTQYDAKIMSFADRIGGYIGQKVHVVLRQTQDGIAFYDELLVEVGKDYLVLDQESGRRASPADPFIHYHIIIPLSNVSRLNKLHVLEERFDHGKAIRV